MWQHPTENDIPAVSRRVLNLPKSPLISLTWSSGIVGAVSSKKAEHTLQDAYFCPSFLGVKSADWLNPRGFL